VDYASFLNSYFSGSGLSMCCCNAVSLSHYSFASTYSSYLLFLQKISKHMEAGTRIWSQIS